MTITDCFHRLMQTAQTKTPLPAHHRQQGHPTGRTTNQKGEAIIPALPEKSKEDFIMRYDLIRDASEPNALYTPDKMFRITRCDVWAYGWTVSVKQEDGTYYPDAVVPSLKEASRMVGRSSGRPIE